MKLIQPTKNKEKIMSREIYKASVVARVIIILITAWGAIQNCLAVTYQPK